MEAVGTAVHAASGAGRVALGSTAESLTAARGLRRPRGDRLRRGGRREPVLHLHLDHAPCDGGVRGVAPALCGLRSPQSDRGRRRGRVAEHGLLTFVGLHPLPVGTLDAAGSSRAFSRRRTRLDIDLVICEATGWARDMRTPRPACPGFRRSPNMPTPATALVYPWDVPAGGTNLSEVAARRARFEIFGVACDRQRGSGRSLNALVLPGVVVSAAAVPADVRQARWCLLRRSSARGHRPSRVPVVPDRRASSRPPGGSRRSSSAGARSLSSRIAPPWTC